jgi:acyl carrier protein
MSHTESTTHKVVHIIVDKLGIDQDKLRYDASFADDLGVDSLDVLELLVTIEKEFQLTIPDEEAEKIKTVGQLIDYVDEKRVTKKLESVSET